METARCKAFLYAVETGSITKAADMMGYSPSGVSQLIHAFEDELDIKLLFRDKKGVSVTEEGEKFLPIIRDLLRREVAITELSAEIKGLTVGSVSIAAYSSIAAHWLPPVIRKFQESYPNIQIQMMEGVRQDVSRWLAEKRADIAFMSYSKKMPYEWIELAEDPMVAILNKSHPLASASTYPIKECEKEHFIMPAYGGDEDVEEMLKRNDLSLNIAFKTLESPSAISMIEQNLGMSIMNRLITERLDFDVVRIPVEPYQYITMGIAIPSLKDASPAVRKFVEVATQMLTKAGTV